MILESWTGLDRGRSFFFPQNHARRIKKSNQKRRRETKSVVTIQKKPIWQFFQLLLFVFQNFTKKNLKFLPNFLIQTLLFSDSKQVESRLQSKKSTTPELTMPMS